MEESVNAQNLTELINKTFDLKAVTAKDFSPLVLAYIGDEIYDLVIRTLLLNRGNRAVDRINKNASKLVRAEAQSRMMLVIEPELDATELGYYKRGRNAKSYTSAKNASIADYRRATGFEALMGALYLNGNYERMLNLMKLGVDAEEAYNANKGKHIVSSNAPVSMKEEYISGAPKTDETQG